MTCSWQKYKTLEGSEQMQDEIASKIHIGFVVKLQHRLHSNNDYSFSDIGAIYNNNSKF